jgi:septal ring factor EnvC (AmiA/AmiB activator)
MISLLQKRNSFVSMKLHFILFILLSFSVSFNAVSQTKKQLQKKREQLQKEMKQINTLLFKSKQQEEALLSELGDLNKRIAVRSRLIRTIDEEENKLSEEINHNQKAIVVLETSLTKLRKEYAAMIVQSYKNKRKQSTLLFLLSSKNFSQAYKRMQYMKQYTSYRKSQGEKIKVEYEKLATLNDSLILKKDEKVLLIALYTKERDSVNSEKTTQVKLVNKVKKEEGKYITQFKRIQNEDNKLNKQIQRLIAEEIARSNKKANSNSSGIVMTPEEKLVASTFVANKGRLPWPTEKGIVVRRYGKQKHPTLAGIIIQSNGIQLATEKNAKARSIFKGKVLSIQLQPGRKKMVLIQHGNYISAYKNLDNVSVKRGQLVDTKQAIGTIHTDATTGKTILAFSLFKNTTLQNPESWISRGKSFTLASK